MSNQQADQDYNERVITSKHELSHALVAYALRCKKIEIKIYKKMKIKSGMLFMGHCGFYCRQKHYSMLIGSAVFASPGYCVQEGDQIELQKMVKDFKKITKRGIPSYRAFVLRPLKDLLECDPVLSIIARLANPLAEGGSIKVANYTLLEKFFPRNINMILLRAACRDFYEIANKYPFPEEE